MNSAAKDFLSGSVVSLVAIAFYLSSAALLFQDSLAPHQAGKPDRLVIDFKRVHWMDSSAAQAMMRIIKVAMRSGVPITFSHTGSSVEKQLRAGGTVGEMGLYRQGVRSATVTADVPSQVLRMRQSTLEQIEARAPALAQGLHRLFVRLLASRLEHANAQSTALAA